MSRMTKDVIKHENSHIQRADLRGGWVRREQEKTEQCGCEPVSEANSLLTGKITGNFTRIGLVGKKSPVITAQNQLLAG